MRVIICGGRAYTQQPGDEAWLESLNITAVYVGGRRGANGVGYLWARARGIPVVVTEAEWGVYGPAAGPLRNTKQLRKLVREVPRGETIGIVVFPEGKGTVDMARQGKLAGVTIYERRHDHAPHH